MSNSLNLPVHEVLVSNVAVEGQIISIRLVGDYHPSSNPAVHLIEIEATSSTREAVVFLTECKNSETPVYASAKDRMLKFESETGEQVEIAAKQITCTAQSFNESELAEVLNRVYSNYLAENEASRKLSTRIEQAKTLLTEFARRTELKSASHSSNSTVSTLYSQHLEHIKRVLSALET